jgi:hypothetical protein
MRFRCNDPCFVNKRTCMTKYTSGRNVRRNVSGSTGKHGAAVGCGRNRYAACIKRALTDIEQFDPQPGDD